MVTSVSSSSNTTQATTSTSTTSSSSTSASASTKSARAAAQSLITSLGSGSGVDINSLADNLANAEISPQKAAIQGKIDKSNATISGYSAVKFVLDNLKTAFADLKDKSSFTSNTSSNSQPAAFNAEVAGANAGNHIIQVTSLAKPQISVSASSFASNKDNINDGTPFDISVTVKGKPIPVVLDQGKTSPIEIAKKISATTGLKASVIQIADTPPSYKIAITGETGSDNVFSVTSNDLSFDTPVQDATNAELTVDGVPIKGSTNVINDAISGVKLTLLSKTAGSATLDISRDVSAVKTKLQTLVTAYNDALSMLGVVSDPKSTVEGYGATLVGNATVASLRSQIRNMVVEPSKAVDPAKAVLGTPSALRDLGISIQQTGKLSLDNAKLSSCLQNNYDDVVNVLAGTLIDSNGKSNYGIARAASDSLDKVLNPIGGTLQTLTNNQNTKISAYQKQLDVLDSRLQVILNRYKEQFSAMDNLVGRIKSTQTGLKSTFDGMMASYTNK